MNVRAIKLAAGRYRITANDRPTALIAEKGERPRFGLRQEWSLGAENASGSITWLAHDFPGLAAIIAAVRTIKGA